MRFPQGFHELSLWLAISSFILLATSELLSPYYGQTGLIIEKSHLRTTALILGVLFLSTVARESPTNHKVQAEPEKNSSYTVSNQNEKA